MGNVTLNSSLRSNLLSLQNTARLQNITQNRLSSGLKVNSAIDSPSSYYTAQSLNNRSKDLSLLLDSMSQAVQTIKSAQTGLMTATSFLEQARAFANKILESVTSDNPMPPIGPVAAIVTNEAELLEALANVNPADGAIVIAKDIVLSKNIGLSLKDNMKLVGRTGAEKLTFNFDSTAKAIGVDLAKGSELSGLVIDYTSLNKTNSVDFHAIRNNGYTDVKLRNLDIIVKSDNAQGHNMAGIRNAGNGEILLEGKINISAPSTKGVTIMGIFSNGTSSKITQSADSELNITTAGASGFGINAGKNVLAGSVNITTSGADGHSIYYSTNDLSGTLNITTSGNKGHGMVGGVNTISGKVNITTLGQYAYSITYGTHNLTSSAQLLIKTKPNNSIAIYLGQLSYATGTKIGIESGVNPAGAGFWQSTIDKTSTSQESFNTFNGVSGWTRIGDFPGIPVVVPVDAPVVVAKALRNVVASVDPVEPQIPELINGFKQYSSILHQFDNLIKDAGYKGINLLLEHNLKINFNEERSSQIEIEGVDASAKGLGLQTSYWDNKGDVKKSIAELDNAITTLRAYSVNFGGAFSITSTREDFTNNLINILTEGSDRLILADMNEESANMLALRTRQQLATNSLSLAAQSSQSILKLF